jgi:hypothetical protein
MDEHDAFRFPVFAAVSAVAAVILAVVIERSLGVEGVVIAAVALGIISRHGYRGFTAHENDPKPVDPEEMHAHCQKLEELVEHRRKALLRERKTREASRSGMTTADLLQVD